MKALPFQYDDAGRAAAGFKGQTSDCVCRAIAIATQQPYHVVYSDLNDLCRFKGVNTGRHRQSAREGITRKVYTEYLEELGWTFVPTMKIGSGCKVHLAVGEIPMEGRIIAKVSKHLVAVVDGVMHDTGNPSRGGRRCVYGYYTKAK